MCPSHLANLRLSWATQRASFAHSASNCFKLQTAFFSLCILLESLCPSRCNRTSSSSCSSYFRRGVQAKQKSDSPFRKKSTSSKCRSTRGPGWPGWPLGPLGPLGPDLARLAKHHRASRTWRAAVAVDVPTTLAEVVEATVTAGVSASRPSPASSNCGGLTGPHIVPSHRSMECRADQRTHVTRMFEQQKTMTFRRPPTVAKHVHRLFSF